MFRDKRKIFGAILGSLMFLSVIFALTYAFYEWRSDSTLVSFSITDASLFCESGVKTNTENLGPVLDYRNGNYQTFLVENKEDEDRDFSLSMNISRIDSSLQSDSLKYKLLVDTTAGENDCSSLEDTSCLAIEGAEGDFSDFGVGINNLVSAVKIPANARYQYYLFIYIDGNMKNDPAMQNSSIISTLDVCEIAAFLDYNNGTKLEEAIKLTSTYVNLPTNITKPNGTVTYNSNGGSSAASKTVSYTFDGWYLEDDFKTKITQASKVTVFTNHILYAKWIQSEAVTLPSVTRTGYTFDGWYSDSELKNKVGDSGESYYPEASLTLYAKWKAHSYNVAYTYNGGTLNEAPTNGVFGTPMTINNPTKTVKITGNANGTDAIVGGATSKAQTFAGWTSTTIDTSTAYYGSTAWANGSTKVKATSFKNLTPTDGATVTLVANWTPVAFAMPTVSKVGYTCNWNTKADGSGTTYNSGASYTPSAGDVDVTVYACCTKTVYNISYTLNGGTSGANAPTTGTYDTEVIIDNPIKVITVTGDANGSGATVGSAISQGQKFAGWTSTTIDTSTAYYGNTAWKNGNTKALANSFKNLTSINGSTVTLVANWAPTTIVLPTVEKDGNTCYWNTKADGSGTSYPSGGNYILNSDSPLNVTMYAVCEANTATITINKNDSAWSNSGMNVALYNGTTSSYAYTSGTANGSTVSWNGVEAGTYNVYAGKNSGEKAALVDTGIDITISNGKTDAGSSSATINYYDLTLNKGTGISAVTGAGTYLKGQTVEINATDADGYKFAEWIVVSGDTPESTTSANTTVIINKATTLTANATENTLTVIYHSNGADSLTYNGSAITESDLVNNYHSTFNYSQNYQNGLLNGNSSSTLYLTKTNYRFSGYWLVDSATSSVKISQNSGGTGQVLAETMGKTLKDESITVHVYAEWIDNTYTITYKLGNASSTAGATEIGTSECTYGASCTLKTWSTLGATFPNSTNKWSFAGWSTSSSGTDRTYTNGQQFTYNTAGNLTLYAVGSRTFNFSYGKAPTSVSNTQTQYWNPYSTAGSYLSAITVPTATAITGWTLHGYRATNDASSAVTIGTTGSQKPAYNNFTDMNFRAIYKRTLTLSFNANGGSGTVSNLTGTQYYNSGIGSGGSNSGANVSTVSFTLPANSFTKSGSSFSKWADGSTSGTQYAAGATYTWSPTVDTTTVTKTFYAIWHTHSSCSLSSGKTFKSTTQTVSATITKGTANLSKYYWGTSSSGTPSTSNTATSLSLTANAAGTWYLRVLDAAGNVGSCSVTMRSYTVNNLLETVAGTTGTYTSANYTSASSATYIIPNGTSLTLASIYTIPTGATSSTFKGYSTGYSTSASSLSTTAPTVSNGTTYYMWFNRSTFALTLSKGTGISSVTGAGTYKYGKSVSIGATASTGYVFDKWTKNSGNSPASTSTASTTVTITQATTLTASGKDTAAPTCSLSSGTKLKATSQTVTATITRGGGTALSKYYWGTSSTGTPGTASTATSLSLTANAAGTWYLRVSDAAGNVGSCSVTMRSYTSYNMYLKAAGSKGTYTTANYDTVSTSGPYIIPNNTTLTISSIYAAPTGSTFAGMSTGAPSTTAATVTTTNPKITANTNYSMWFNRTEYTVSYNACNGSGAPSAQTKRYGVNLTLSSTKPTRSGYTFKGWASSAAGVNCSSATTVAYAAGGTYSNNENVTLYAVWEALQYLKDKAVGSYVSFTGNNGCSGSYCSGTTQTYCQYSSNGNFSVSGWRIAYVANGTAYLVSGGAPECMCTNDNDSNGNTSAANVVNGTCSEQNWTSGVPTHLSGLATRGLKYCNATYAYGGVCNSTSAWAMKASDFQAITGVTLASAHKASLTNVINNTLINNGGYYWFATLLETYYTYVWNSNSDKVDNWDSGKSFGVRPVIRLKADIKVTGGSGTSSSPYTIST